MRERESLTPTRKDRGTMTHNETTKGESRGRCFRGTSDSCDRLWGATFTEALNFGRAGSLGAL